MKKPQVAIGLVASERWYCIRGLLAGLETLETDKGEIPLFVAMNGEDVMFHDFLAAQLRKQGWRSVKVLKTDLAIISIGSGTFGPDNDLRFTKSVQCFNKLGEAMVDCGASYGWYIEDDVVVPPDALRKHLALFRPGVGASCSFCIQRWDSPAPFTRHPLVWDYWYAGQKWDLSKPLPASQEANIQAEAKFPGPERWVEEIGAASTGSIMLPCDILRRLKWEVSYRGVRYYDTNLGLKLHDLGGYKSMIDWSLKCKHIHKTGEVLL